MGPGSQERGLEDGRPDLRDQDAGAVGGLNELGVELAREVSRLALPPRRDVGVTLSASDVAASDRDVELVDNAVHDLSSSSFVLLTSLIYNRTSAVVQRSRYKIERIFL